MTSKLERNRARRVLGVIGSVVGVSVMFVAASACAAVVHLDLPAARRLVATQVNGILETNLAGTVQIDHIAALGLGGACGVRARVYDPEGVQVIHVDGVCVRIRALEAARSALFGKGPIAIDVPSASVGNVDVNLDADRTGNLRIANAFAAKKPPTPKKPNEPPGRGVRVEAPVVRLDHAWVHGTPPGAPLVDADLSGLEARAYVDPSVTRAELDRVHLVTRSLPRGADPRGTIGGKLAIPAPNGQGMDVQAVFEGRIAGVRATLEARMNDRRIDARFDAHDPTGGQMSSIVDGIAIRDPISLHVEAHGDLPRVETQAKLLLGKARLDASAIVVAGASTEINGSVSARNVDVSAVSRGAPETNVGLDARAALVFDDGGIRGEASFHTLPGTIDRQAIPRVEARGKFEGKAAQVRARIHDKAMPTEVAVNLAPREGAPDAQVLTAAVRSRIPDLRRVPKIGTRVGGSAAVDASARMLLPENVIDSAEVTVVLTRVKDEQLSVGRLEAKARAQGTIDRPVIDAEVHARQLLTETLPLASLDARARARVETIEKAITIRDARVDAARSADEKISASARLVRIHGPSLRVEGAEVCGVGDPIRVELSKDAREVRASIDAPRIDVPLAARIAGKNEPLGIRSGTLAVRGEATLRGGVAKGKVHAELRDLAMREAKRAGAVIDASIDDREVALDIGANVGDSGVLRVHAERLVIDGRVDDPRSWKRAAGRVHLDGAVDMERAAPLLPAKVLPVADVRGLLTVQGSVSRDAPDAAPEVQLHAHTNGLVVAGPPGPTKKVGGIEVTGPPRWRSTDLDFGLDVRNDGTSGLTSVAFRATDRHGAVVALDAKTILPYAEIAAEPARARDRATTAPINATLVIPPRQLDRLPSILGVNDVQGAIEAELVASGTLLEPTVRLVARTRGVRSPALPPDARADADVIVDYDGRIADLSANVRARGEALLDVRARVEARARDVVVGNGALPWNASGHLRLASFPLQTVPQLAERQIRGNVSGELTLAGLHADAHVEGRLDLDGFAVGKAQYTKGFLSFDAGRGKLAAKVRLEQNDGFLDATLANGLVWGAEVTPKLDAEQPLEAKLQAKSFRAAAIQPFVQSAVPMLDGRIDANATARIVPGQRGAAIDGDVKFHHGIVQIAALGDELRGVRASVALTRDGTVRVTDVYAKGTQGELHADAQAKLDGMRVAHATANIGIPQKSPLSIALQGQPFGQVSGAIKVEASQSPDGKETSVTVDVPKMNFELPQVMKSGVQSLEQRENIRVGVYRGRNRFVELPLEKAVPTGAEDLQGDATRLDVDVRLGRITIDRGNQLTVHLTGNPKVSIEGGESKLDGRIRIDGGWVDVQGKKFEIEKGTVTFTGESPPNPVVVATAAWTAADGSRIFADFVGPVKTGKVNLRSEPPRPNSEILALVLFGTADGANPRPAQPGTKADGTTKTAVGLGGGFVAQGLTEALDDLAGIQATARIDTTRSNNPRPEVDVQLSPRVSIGYAHVIGTPPITAPDKNLANIEYRFHRNWSLETTFGDRGTALLDAIWQKRY
ncbi:MAG: hypothetical protein BGO98_02095 [Myxococcales bacterium 68-20]|nr:translocation/assembly module TamB domain-containing protein [Myxococcales bacterium]OJY21640.1 MAG: hypothetical protein BGO98_02095 [Myxococcales bacterium 68-20]